ncbi:MAG: outer membrane protein assembly factor BamD [Acidobacteria bacterium]|nr:outer membrane protein assembly factor BamD [Acidobacteriota bacterium]
MKNKRCARLQFWLRLLVVPLTASVTLACIWSLYTDHSVRFNSFRKGRGFYRLPPLPIMYDRKTGQEIYYNTMDASSDFETKEYTVKEPGPPNPFQPNADELWEQARTAQQLGKLNQVQSLLQQYVKATAIRPLENESEQQLRRNSAVDRLDALSALRQGSSAAVVTAYLSARDAYDAMVSEMNRDSANFPAKPEENEHWQMLTLILTDAAKDRNLSDNWDYLRAAQLFQTRKNDSALAAFQQHITQHPHSEKNEAAMYMVAKLTREFSYSFENTGCGIRDKDEWEGEIDPAQFEPKEKCQDESWRASVKAFQQLMRKYPNGRYFNDARGWLAYLYRRGGERTQALAEYYRLLGHPTDWNARLEAKKSLQMIGHNFDDATLDQVEDLIADDANAALAYAYHRIYNCAVDFTYTEANDWAYYDENEHWQKKEEEEKRVAGEHKSGNHELTRVARFASAMMKRHPKANISGSFVLRVAQAQFELQNYSEALSLARKALAMAVQGDAQAQALWIKGSAEHLTKDVSAARSTFTQLITKFPKSNLTEGARRLLAMTAEDQGDYEAALEQYLALNYVYDVAYFVDVLMPTERLAKFVMTHKHAEQYNELVYALGIRYMRDKRWNEARATLQRVQTKAERRNYDWQIAGEESHHSFSKGPDWEWRETPFIKTSWVMQDLQTIDALERLEQAIGAAQNDEAKAEAMYQLASYQFDADSLLFYNPMAWRGQRYWLLSGLDGSDHLRLPNESKIILNHSQDHETLARAIPIYLETVNRFPRTKAAKDALYSVAVAHQHLSNLNPYWRGIYGQGLFVGPQFVTYADVRRIYPHYQLPRGTNGWEASTRTVNGGPGWAPPPPKPEPAPKLTRAQKFKRRLTRFLTYVQADWQRKVSAAESDYSAHLQRCLYAVLAGLGLIGIWYGVELGRHFWKLRAPVVKPEIIGLFAASVPPDSLPDSESRVEKVIGNDG